MKAAMKDPSQVPIDLTFIVTILRYGKYGMSDMETKRFSEGIYDITEVNENKWLTQRLTMDTSLPGTR